MDTPARLPTWRQMNSDTTPEAEAVLLRLWRETPGWRKWELMEDMNRTARAGPGRVAPPSSRRVARGAAPPPGRSAAGAGVSRPGFWAGAARR